MLLSVWLIDFKNQSAWWVFFPCRDLIPPLVFEAFMVFPIKVWFHSFIFWQKNPVKNLNWNILRFGNKFSRTIWHSLSLTLSCSLSLSLSLPLLFSLSLSLWPSRSLSHPDHLVISLAISFSLVISLSCSSYSLSPSLSLSPLLFPSPISLFPPLFPPPQISLSGLFSHFVFSNNCIIKSPCELLSNP